MAPGKPFFSLGASKQRRASEKTDQKQQATAAWERPVTGLYKRSSLSGGHKPEQNDSDDVKHTKDQDISLHETKKPSLFKQLFQKCECCFATLDLQQCIPSAYPWHHSRSMTFDAMHLQP